MHNISPILLTSYNYRGMNPIQTTPTKTMRNSSYGAGGRKSPARYSSGGILEKRKSRQRRSIGGSEDIEKELIELKLASPTPMELQRLENQRISKFLDFDNMERMSMQQQHLSQINFSQDKGIYQEDALEGKLKKFLVCKIHNENFSFFSPDERKMYCTKCFYNQYEKMYLANPKKIGQNQPTVLPLENALEWINKENKNFIKQDGRQTICQIDHAISLCQFNNNFLLKKQDIFEKMISQEFHEIQEWLKKRELELLEHIKSFFDKKIKENIEQLQELKFYQESFKSLLNVNQATKSEFQIYQFSFTNALKKALANADLECAKLTDKDVDILDFYSKKDLKKKIESLGKPLQIKSYDQQQQSPLLSTPRGSVGPNGRNSVTSQSPLRSSRNHGIATTPRSNNKARPSPRSNSAAQMTPSAEKTSNTARRSSPAKVLPIVNKKALEQISKDRLPPDSAAAALLSRRGRDSQNNEPAPFSDNNVYPFIKEYTLFENSKILQNLNMKHEALELFPNKFQRTTLLYSLSHNGAGSKTFHEMCDNNGPHIMLVKTNSKYIFGFYSPLSFTKHDKYCGNEHFWIFSLVNDYKRPMVFKIKPEKSFIGLYNSQRSPCLGSTLKGKEDLFIDFDDLKSSCSKIGYAYKMWDSGNIDGARILSGSQSNWNINEIEVYHVD